MPQPNQTFRTLQVATLLCIACSFVVSVAAVGLQKPQEENKKLDRQKNILDATGLSVGEFGRSAKELSKEQIDELYARVSERLVDLETGKFVDDIDVAKYDVREAAQDPEASVAIDANDYDPGIGRREKIAKVYLVSSEPGGDDIKQIVLPVYGKGLWSTMYGYLAVNKDLETIEGLTFYEHGETPGLGGEVDNPSWKAQWVQKKLFDDQGEPAATVVKGTAARDNPYAVDGLSGATITSRGVEVLLRYWVSDDGYGPFLSQLNEAQTSVAGS